MSLRFVLYSLVLVGVSSSTDRLDVLCKVKLFTQQQKKTGKVEKPTMREPNFFPDSSICRLMFCLLDRIYFRK